MPKQKEYLQQCLQNYLNDEFEIEEALYLYSYLLKNNIADKLTIQFRETADHLVNTLNWLTSDGKILVELEEAQQCAEQVQKEMQGENKNESK